MFTRPRIESEEVKPLLGYLFALPLLSLMILGGMLSWQIVSLINDQSVNERTDRVLSNANALYRQLADLETGIRGYLLTGYESFATPYDKSAPLIDSTFNNLRKLSADNEVQFQRIIRMESRFREWNQYASQVRNSQNPKRRFQSIVSHFDGKALMDTMRASINSFIATEESLKTNRTLHSQSLAQMTILGGITFILLFGTSLCFFTRHLFYRLSNRFKENLQTQKENLAILSAFYDASSVGFAFLDKNLRYVSVNESLALMNHLSVKDFIGNTVQQVVPHIADAVIPRLKKVIETRQASRNFHLQIPPHKLNNEEASERIANYYPVILPGTGELVGVGVTVVDVTDMRKVEEQVRFQAELLSQVNNAVIALNNDGQIVYWNKGAERMLGYESQKTIGRKIEELVRHRWHTPEEERVANLSLATGDFWYGEKVLIDSKGKEIVTEGSITVIKDAQGNPKGRFSVMQDITSRKLMETQLKIKSEELARSNADLDQFASIVSHDLKEPLRIITTYLQLLRSTTDHLLDSEARQSVQFAADSAERMAGLIDTLLSYSRLSTSERELERIHLSDVLATVCANLQTSIYESHARITYDKLPTVMADSSQMVQIFQNLIANAIKYRRENRPEIHIGARLEGQKWVFSVSDNGIGIEPENYDRIFLIFQRLHAKDTYKGSGIGLAICKKIVERAGGKIWVEPNPETGGSIFYFTMLYHYSGESPAPSLHLVTA